MKLLIDESVHRSIEAFYAVAMSRHITLGELTIMRKKRRLYAALRDLAKFPIIYPKARFIQSWKEKGYHVFLCEDFHFAYEICYDPIIKKNYVYVVDVVHSLNYHD